jgi:hypothetical protein
MGRGGMKQTVRDAFANMEKRGWMEIIHEPNCASRDIKSCGCNAQLVTTESFYATTSEEREQFIYEVCGEYSSLREEQLERIADFARRENEKDRYLN